MTPSAALEALVLEPLFFLLQFELFFVRAYFSR